MSDDGDKTEEPTDHKLKKAREEGNVPRSTDLNGAVIIVLMVMILALGAETAIFQLKESTAACFDTIFTNTTLTPQQSCFNMVAVAANICFVMFAGSILGAFIAYFIINKGFVIPKTPLKFNIQALDLFTNTINMFKKENFVNTAISIIKESIFYGLYGVILYYFFMSFIFEAHCIENCSGTTSLYFIIILTAVFTLFSVLLAAIDLPIKIIFYKSKLKMSHKDLKDERKELDGNPQIKQERDNFRWELLNSVPMGAKNSTFFVKSGNVMFGIRYNREESPAPMVVWKGKDDNISKGMFFANQLQRMVLNDDEFGRGLNSKARVGRPVPLEFITPLRSAIMKLRQHESKVGPTHPPKQPNAA